MTEDDDVEIAALEEINRFLNGQRGYHDVARGPEKQLACLILGNPNRLKERAPAP